MNEYMINQWNSVVKENDKVYHLGDFGFGNQEQITEIVSQLKGRIYLVKGNHDVRSNQWYRDCGFVEVYDHSIIINEFIVLTHEPLPFAINHCMAELFGHIHDSPMYKTWGRNNACMCVERHNYTPVSLERIKEKFTEGNND